MTTFISIMMGSQSDLSTMQATIDVLKSLGISYEVRISSAHRTPEETQAYIKDAEKRGAVIFVAAAGLAAHLAGTVAAHTVKPVIGVPIDTGPLNGLDALLSTVQMPGGVPVATVAIGKHGAKNAGYLAAQMLALSEPAIQTKLQAERKKKAEQIKQQNEALQTA